MVPHWGKGHVPLSPNTIIVKYKSSNKNSVSFYQHFTPLQGLTLQVALARQEKERLGISYE